MKIKIENCFIKGYHIYHIRPHPDVAMDVRHEEDNCYDPDAHSVFMPDLEKIPTSLHCAVTAPAKKGRPEQTVQQIAGEMVGRIPANLGKMLKEDMKHSLAMIQW